MRSRCGGGHGVSGGSRAPSGGEQAQTGSSVRMKRRVIHRDSRWQAPGAGGCRDLSGDGGAVWETDRPGDDGGAAAQQCERA